ncbi:MAG: hypothetical protein EOO88_15485 [Pedobacter sp.]|nr:MAG: hypothetical protein EOO88_15485 [Pedobacter sp.]
MKPLKNNTLTAGTAIADITPPLEVGLLTSSVQERWAPFESLRLPLKARVIYLQYGVEKFVLISLDLIGLTNDVVGGWDQFKSMLSDIIPPERIVITCTHTHNAPETISLTDLYKKDQFHTWLNDVKAKLKIAISSAISDSCFCTISHGVDQLTGFSLQRRIPSEKGIIMSDSIQPIAEELMNREPVDHRVHTLQINSLDGHAVATIVQATCHPVHEMCLPHISPDFPGELCNALDQSLGSGMSMFLNGAAADTNPPTVSMGEAYAHEHGLALANVVQQIVKKATPIDPPVLAFVHKVIKFDIRLHEEDFSNHTAYINILSLGHLALVFLPGEIFVETGLAIEAASPFEKTIIVGFSESSIGYVPSLKIFSEGGYETGPGKWSFLQQEAEGMLITEVSEMLHELQTLIH